MVLFAQFMTPSKVVIQSMPRMTSSPCESRTTRLAENLCFPNSRTRSQQPAFTNNSSPGELTLIGQLIVSVGILFLTTNALENNE
jgi:hypothetical protein